MERSLWPAEAGKSAAAGYRGMASILVPLCLVVYLVVGFARIRTTDWVPFSSWALFVFVPNQPSTYAVRILSMGDRVFDPPADLQDAKGAGGRLEITSYYLINKFGAARDKGDSAAAAAYRRLLEANTIPAESAWELIRVTYDPLDRWSTGRMEDKVVGVFGPGDRHD